MYYLYFPLLWLISYLPLKVLYAISDFCKILIFRVIGYRIDVVRKNLKNSFPQQSEEFLREKEDKFYRHFCDTMFETLWFWHASPKKIRKHLKYQNLDVFDYLKSKNKDVIILFGHYCNWEWNAFVPQDLKGGLYDVFTLYKPLKDKKFDEFTKKIREKFGVGCVTNKNFLRTLVNYRKSNIKAAFAFIADQSPWGNNVHYWTKFLNQDTTFLTGWEDVARKFNLAVIYVDMQKISRGKYVYRPEILCENPAELSEFELTEQYVRRFERNILIEPAFWLWTHKRWKVKKS